MKVDSGNEVKFNSERYPVKDEKIIMEKSKIDTELDNLEVIKKKTLDTIGD